ncbi:MAG: hypothetical protein ACUVUG_02125 [Candidatus Aminicenantia bacterium]
MIFQSHLFSMILYAFFTSLVLSLIRKEGKDRIKYGLTLFLIMVFGSIAFAWLMFPFPF